MQTIVDSSDCGFREPAGGEPVSAAANQPVVFVVRADPDLDEIIPVRDCDSTMRDVDTYGPKDSHLLQME